MNLITVNPMTCAIIVAGITGTIEMLKACKIQSNYFPAISAGLGVMCGVLFVELSPIGGAIGYLLGLASCGLFDQSKLPFKKEVKDNE